MTKFQLIRISDITNTTGNMETDIDNLLHTLEHGRTKEQNTIEAKEIKND